MGINTPVNNKGDVEICPELNTKHPAPQLQHEVIAEEDLQLMPTVPWPWKPGPGTEQL